jgi:dTDP-4-amino-4,6-dideoxyglucose formyltransferase
MRILIVTDNIYMFSKVKEIIKKKSPPNCVFIFKRSPGNNLLNELPEFKNSSSIVDVKLETQELINQFDLIISAHCKQFFPKELVNKTRCINIHPGYNPINRGWYPQVFALKNDLPIGATIHEMDAKLDNGPIICRTIVEKYEWDTSSSLYKRILDAEITLFDSFFDNIIKGKYQRTISEENGNFFSKSDFDKICIIDLQKVGTFKEFYNTLRSLSHDEYWNSYFISEKGEKIFIKLNIKKVNE